MCTSIKFGKRFFARTLDFERDFGEELIFTKRGALRLLESENRYEMMGVGVIKKGMPLYFDGVNEWGLAAAALNFPDYAVYSDKSHVGTSIFSAHLISFILGLCRDVSEVRDCLGKICISGGWVDEKTPPAPLHWIFADQREAITVESVAEGLRIYNNPMGILTNAPDFNYHMTRLADFSALQAENPDSRFTHSPPYSSGMGGIGLPGDFSSSSRFVRAAFIKENMPEVSGGKDGDITRLFAALASFEIPRGAVLSEEGEPVFTRYTAVIDMEEPSYYLTTHLSRSIVHAKLGDRICEGTCLLPFFREEQIISL